MIVCDVTGLDDVISAASVFNKSNLCFDNIYTCITNSKTLLLLILLTLTMPDILSNKIYVN